MAKSNQVLNNVIICLHPKDKGPIHGTLLRSYDSNIAFASYGQGTFLDQRYWNYSRTTAKWRNKFLGESTKVTQSKIDNGIYKLVNLN